MYHPGRGLGVDLHRLVQGSVADQSSQPPFAVAGPDGVEEFVERLGKVDLRCSVIEAEIGERVVDLVDVEGGRAEGRGVGIETEVARVLRDRFSVVGVRRVDGCGDQLVAVDAAAVPQRARFAVYALNRRAAEAAAIRTFVSDLLAGDGKHRALIVAGDLNDEPEAATTQLLHGLSGSEIGTTGFNRPDTGDGQRLWNLAPRIPENQRFSRLFRGRGELIDHLLVSHVLVKAVQTVTTGAIEIPSITEEPTERRDEPGSDHWPVVAVFDVV